MSDRQFRNSFRDGAAHTALLIGALGSALPFLWMLLISAVPQDRIFADAVIAMPTMVATIENYTAAFTEVPLVRFMLNGMIVCFIIVTLQILVAAPCGYALAKLEFRGCGLLFSMVLVSLLIPVQIPAIPLYIVAAKAGLLDTYTAQIFPWTISAFAIFLFRQFFRTFASEILDAARLDGYGEFAIVWRIMLPNAWPAVTAFSIFSFVAHWNDLYWPMVVITSPELMTAPLGIAYFRQAGDAAGNVGALMAGGVVVTAPLVLAFLFAQRQFLRGLTFHSP